MSIFDPAIFDPAIFDTGRRGGAAAGVAISPAQAAKQRTLTQPSLLTELPFLVELLETLRDYLEANII